MSDTIEGRRRFLKIALVSAGAVVGALGASILAPGQEVRIGKPLAPRANAEAAGTCGAAADCAGGGGQCGAAANCAGGGGKCGAAADCAGGGGKCGAAANCAGS